MRMVLTAEGGAQLVFNTQDEQAAVCQAVVL
jgi:hypothetical protein